MNRDKLNLFILSLLGKKQNPKNINIDFLRQARAESFFCSGRKKQLLAIGWSLNAVSISCKN